MGRANRGRGVVATCALGLALLWAPPAHAGITVRAPEKYQFAQPFGCDQARYQYLLDETHDICGGVSQLRGRGWAAAPRRGAVMGVQHYISRYNNPTGAESAVWWPTIAVPGRYEIWVDWRASANRARRTPYYVYADDGNYLYWVNQFINDHSFSGVKWAKLGTHEFVARTAVKGVRARRGTVKVLNNPRDHSEGVDGVGFRYVGPGIPSGPAATRDGTDAVTLSWNAALGAKGYQISRYDVGARTRVLLTADPDALGYADAQAAVGATYVYRVRAVGYQVGSVVKKGPWSVRAVGYVVLGAPSGLAATDSLFDAVELRWEPVAGAAGYEVLRGTSDDPAAATLAGRTSGETSFADAAAVPGQSYFYWVRAVDSGRHRSALSAAAAGSRALAAPALVATDGTYADRVELAWTVVEGAVSYEVFRHSDDVVADAVALGTVTGQNSSADTTAVPGAPYYYWVRAVGASGGVSAFSNSARGSVSP